MMSLIFLMLFIAMLCAFTGKKSLSFGMFAVTVLVSVYWFHHHANDALSILL
ncbi:DUF5993 family protein [Vibrio aquimaris]|uniref:Uncharacterized protein n=1 Tax=Vibrio aquimaris TaxID=2587862 RepID=A0A5P9CJM6_9VIBR|nr:DUF5993 family protein [Vibrio aquimaris]QFT25907.1 hypothetical protein FIV01_05660 [Vibrio aquimaris]